MLTIMMLKMRLRHNNNNDDGNDKQDADEILMALKIYLL